MLRPADLRSVLARAARSRHLELLLFWPIFSLVFWYAEHLFPAAYYYPMVCSLDRLIPFCKWSVIPYVLWFPFVGGMLVCALVWDPRAFRRMMWFIILTYSTALLTYFLFPTCQYLRPRSLPDGGLLSQLVAALYSSDTNTNVCPSIHVLGSFAVWFAARDMRRFAAWPWQAFFFTGTVLISLSTVFMKQHSVLDVTAALVVCGVFWPVVYRAKARRLFGVPAPSRPMVRPKA